MRQNCPNSTILVHPSRINPNPYTILSTTPSSPTFSHCPTHNNSTTKPPPISPGLPNSSISHAMVRQIRPSDEAFETRCRTTAPPSSYRGIARHPSTLVSSHRLDLEATPLDSPGQGQPFTTVNQPRYTSCLQLLLGIFPIPPQPNPWRITQPPAHPSLIFRCHGSSLCRTRLPRRRFWLRQKFYRNPNTERKKKDSNQVRVVGNLIRFGPSPLVLLLALLDAQLTASLSIIDQRQQGF